MYDQIASNKRRTVFLIVVFIALISGIAYGYGWYSGQDALGMMIPALLFSSIMAMVSYYHGDKVALSSAHAKPVTKTDNAYLCNMVENLCITNGQPMPKVYVMQDNAINAFATGRNPEKASIAVTTGALTKLTNEELEGVLAHELSHVKNYDIRVMTIVIILVGLVSLLADWMMRAHLFGGRRRDSNNDSGGGVLMIVGLVFIILSPIFAQLIQLAISRRREYLADASGALLTRYPEGLANALEKIKQENQPLRSANRATAHMYIANPFGKMRGAVAGLFSTHPPIDDRIKQLRTMGH